MWPRLLLALVFTASVASTGCGVLQPYCPPASVACPPGMAVCPPAGAVCPPAYGEAAVSREVVAPAVGATPREAPAPREREVVREVVREREQAVTQDMLLVPRTVYMPYMPHTPTAPVRMRATELQEHVYQEERGIPRDAGPAPREAAQPRPAAGPDERVLETLDKCSQMMMRMDQRLSDLESRVAAPGNPPTQVVTCPPPAPVQPIRRLFNRVCPPVDYCPPVPECLPVPACPPVPVPAPCPPQ